MKGILITGTDTGVGKTFVACWLAAALSRRGLRIGILKPVETDCRERNGTLEAKDATQLKFYSNCELPLEILSPFRFRAPRAPWIAAQEAGSEIPLSQLEETYRCILAQHDITLVEGAGGLMVPLHRNFNYADLARAWGLSVLLVTTAKLGTLNHTQLTLAYTCYSGLSTIGYIVNTQEPTPSTLITSNLKALSQLISKPCLGVIPYSNNLLLGRVSTESLASLFESLVDWDTLDRALTLNLI